MTAVSVLAQLTEKRDALPDWVHQPSQAATYPRAFVDVAVGRGADRSDLLSRAGVAEQCFVDPGASSPFMKWLVLWRPLMNLPGITVWAFPPATACC